MHLYFILETYREIINNNKLIKFLKIYSHISKLTKVNKAIYYNINKI